jgi:hypothetical protein
MNCWWFNHFFVTLHTKLKKEPYEEDTHHFVGAADYFECKSCAERERSAADSPDTAHRIDDAPP